MPRSKWNRKRKAEAKLSKSGKDHKDKDAANDAGYKLNQDYSVAKQSNPKMEAYYSLVGLHNTSKRGDGTFQECASDEAKTLERERFMSSLRSILPASFRIDRSLDTRMQHKLIEEMKEFVGKEIEIEIELPKRSEAVGGMKTLLDKSPNSNDETKEEVIKRKIAPAKPIPFLSSNNNDKATKVVLGYQLSVDRRTLRRNPSLTPLHEWMKIHTDCGHLTRQETVSMIPPVVLDAKPGMSVLDMCAAPGSKTCQLVEVVGGMNHHRDDEVNDNGEEGMKYHEPKGYVVANDADPKRAYMLVTQLRRLQSPNVFVTSCDGQYFPILDEKKDKGTVREGMFDRVLCDVPCSGDGTVRKNPGIWRHWNQNGALALHPLQLSIALRGARVTNVGGYLVYSTCSMNPMENESVVAELLRITNGSLVLEDPRPRMEGLVARPGWNSWKVLREHNSKAKKDHKKKNSAKMNAKRKEWQEKRHKAGGGDSKELGDDAAGDKEEEKFERSPYYTLPYVGPETWDEETLRERTTSLGFVEYATYGDVEPEWRRRVRASCFPPTEAEAKAFELHKCLRCLPHDMDTGGFFVALFKKVKPLSLDATARMHQMARESRGGIEVDAHLNSNGDKKDDTEAASNTGVVKDEGCVVKAEPSEEQTDDEPNVLNETEAQVKEEKDDGDAIQKAPTGRIGINHNKKKKENGDLGNDDFIPLDDSIWPPIIEEFGISSDFPKEQYMARASGEAKVLYFIAKSIKEQIIDRGIQNRVTVINSGLKAFERCSIAESRNKYRISQEAIQFVLPYMTKRVIVACADDFYKCCAKGFMEFGIYSQEFQDKIGELAPGSFVVLLNGQEKDTTKKMFLVMWKRSNALECFVSKVEMDGMVSKLRALGFDAPEPEPAASNTEDAEEEKVDT